MAETPVKCCFIFFLLCSSALSSMAEMKKVQTFPSPRKKLNNGFNAVVKDSNTFPVTPDNPAPIIITVPGAIPANPVTIPTATPLPIPTTTPVTVPSTNPGNPTTPVTNPVTTPVTNPVTTYPTTPAGGGGVPVTNPIPPPVVGGGGAPVTNPISPPAVGGVPGPVTNPIPPPTSSNNAPAGSGQSWCVAKTGAPEASLQSALDYACGSGKADCSQIQQGGSCYNPISLQNHASFAFNSYYQKNPVPTSCDFGGTATIVGSNPSSGSCIYPSSAGGVTSTSTPTSTPTTTPSTITPTSTPPTTSSTAFPSTSTPTPTPFTTPSTSGVSSGLTPSVLNSSTPDSSTTTIPGFDTPTSFNSSTSMSSELRPFLNCFILMTSFMTGALILYA